MKIKLILLFVCLSIVAIASFPREKHSDIFSLDNAVFQQYNGKTGRWVSATNKTELNALIKEFGSSSIEVAILNPEKTSAYIFIPYSEKYIIALGKEGYKQTFVSAPPDTCIWPVETGMKISSAFGNRGSNFHPGIDIPAERGTFVRAAMEGQVSFVGYNGGYGNMVDISHLNNYLTRYGHNTAILVRQGDFVRKGQVIALSGSTGISTGSHVHYEIRHNDIPLNPLEYLPSGSKIQIVHSLQN